VWTPKGFDWVYRRFVAEPVEGYGVVLAQPYENRHLLGQVPDFYERLQHSYDKRFFEQEVLGQYLNVTAGRAYHQFDRAANVVNVTYDPWRPVLWALDFNVDPMCSIVAQMVGEKVIVIDEIVLHRATTAQACSEFHYRYGNAMHVVVYGDATGNRMQTTGSSDHKVIQQFFRSAGVKAIEYRVPSVNPPVRDRLDIMNGALRSASGEHLLLIDPRCKELIADLEQVTLQEGTMVIDKTKDPRRTHLSDALGYLMWQERQRRINTVGPVNKRLLSL
jgi:hypothetical protein